MKLICFEDSVSKSNVGGESTTWQHQYIFTTNLIEQVSLLKPLEPQTYGAAINAGEKGHERQLAEGIIASEEGAAISAF